jgi:hypothetical protein
MPAHKRLTDEQIDALMQEFRAQRLRLRDFATQKSIPIPTFRRWFKEWEEKQRDIRLAALPEKPLAWLPPENLSGYKENPPIRDGLLTLMVDLADNLGPHTDQALHITLCCDGLVVVGRLIGAKEYFEGMREIILGGAGELMEKYRQAAEQAFEKLLPDTERLPERREEWDDFYEPDDRRESPDFVHLANATIHSLGSNTQVPFWRGRLCAVTSFWMD